MSSSIHSLQNRFDMLIDFAAGTINAKLSGAADRQALRGSEKSHWYERPTSQSSQPSAQTISVLLAIKETMRGFDIRENLCKNAAGSGQRMKNDQRMQKINPLAASLSVGEILFGYPAQ